MPHVGEIIDFSSTQKFWNHLVVSVNDHEICHAFKDGFSQSQALLNDSRASSHMVSSKESFPSLEITSSPSIHMVYDSKIPSTGKGSVQFKHGVFNNVLYVPSLVENLLFIYQMTDTASP